MGDTEAIAGKSKPAGFHIEKFHLKRQSIKPKNSFMKRLLLNLAAVVVLSLIWYGESRKFFCLDNGGCVSVWETLNHVCYIIPGRY